MSSQNIKFVQTRSRFGSSSQRNASNLGVHRQGALVQISSRSRLIGTKDETVANESMVLQEGGKSNHGSLVFVHLSAIL